MKITAELKAELEKYGFKHFKIAGLDHFTNSKLKEGLELKNNHINPYVIDETGKNYSPAKLHEDTELCITIIENMNEIVEVLVQEQIKQAILDVLNPAKTYIETGELLDAEIEQHHVDNPTCTQNPDSAILPLYLTKAMFDKHPGTIAAILSLQDTPEMYVESFGNKSYVEGHYVTRALNWIFKYKWSSVHEETREDDLEFSVKMQFTAIMDDGTTISKGIIGTADKKFSKTIKDENGNRQVIQIGDTIKAAITDAKKKFYSELGGSQDVYSGLNKGR